MFAAWRTALFALDSIFVNVPADTQHQSVFLRTFNPAPLLQSVSAGCGVSTGFSAASGLLFLNRGHNVKYDETVESCLRGINHYNAILTALHGKMISALGSAGFGIAAFFRAHTISNTGIEYGIISTDGESA